LKPKNDVDLGLLDSLSYLTQCCFHNRRKTFINNIKNIFSQDKVCELMQLFSIPINARSEEINYQTFVSMAQWFKNTYQSMG
jgi:16S rRNA A1518/A1519 N6-dimethyltransferase RsmA/KsgA/DIM1 with predicted DNA glycosylase/AP lyase activity